MTNEEAIRRLVDIGRTIKIKTEGDERNYIALEMAVNALQNTQRVENIEKAEECRTLNTEIGKKYVEGLWKPNPQTEKNITIADLDIMTKTVNEKQVEMELTITPDQQQVIVRPWKPMKYTTIYGGDEDDKRDRKQ